MTSWNAKRVRRTLLLLVAVYGSSLLAVGLHVRAYPKFSPLDELQHFDYMVKASRGDVVRKGERVGQTAMREEACRGLDASFRPPPCDTARFDPDDFQEHGYNTADSQAPLYYGATGLVARLIVATGLTDSLLTGGRLAGGLWLGTGLLVLLALLHELRVGRFQRFVAVMLVLAAPVVLHASATVNPDGSLLVGGGLVLLAVLRWERGALSWWWAGPIAFVAYVLDPATALAVFLGVVYVGVRVVQRRTRGEGAPRPPSELVRLVGALGTAVVLAFVVGTVVRKSIALDVGDVVLPRDVARRPTTLSLGLLARQVPVLVTPLDKPFMPAFLRTEFAVVFVTVTGWLALAASLGGALFGRVGSRITALAVATTTVMLAGGPLWVLYRLPADKFFPIQARYGLSFVPALVALVAASLDKRPALVAVGGYAALVLGYTLTLLVRA